MRRRQGDGVEVDVGWAGSGGVHGGARLRQEVLDDHLLHVAVATMRGGDDLERLDAVVSVLPDPDEDPRGERDGQLPCPLEGVEATLRCLVGRTAVAVEIGAQGLDHHPLGWGDRSQRGQLVPIEGPGVGVGEQPGLVEDQSGHGREVVDGRPVAVLVEPLSGDRVAQLGPLTEGEEGLVTTDACPGSSDGEHLIGREVRGAEARRWLGEGAVPALVPAEHREGDEHLGRVRDPVPVGSVAHRTGLGHQLFPRHVEGHRHGGTLLPVPARTVAVWNATTRVRVR